MHLSRVACPQCVHSEHRDLRGALCAVPVAANKVLWATQKIVWHILASFGLDVRFAPCAPSRSFCAETHLTGRTFKLGETVDFVVVGSGAAGGVIARELSQAGFSVIVMEQGPRLGPGDFEHDELKYNYLSGITVDPKVSPQTFREDASQVAQRPVIGNSLIYARIVGGSSAHFTANYWRFHDNDFNERSLLGPIAGTGFADWPLTHQELEPYYTKVEWEIGVSGLASASPFDPPRTKGYPMPPLPAKSSGVLLEKGARKLGLHAFPAPMAINSQLYRGRPGCAHCGFCIGFGCEVMAKSTTLYTMIPEAEATGRCEI